MIGVGIALWSQASFGVVTSRVPIQATEFVFDPSDLKASIALPTDEREQWLPLPVANILERVDRSGTDETIEPIQLRLQPTRAAAERVARQLARAGKADEVADFFMKGVGRKRQTDERFVTIEVTRDALSMMRPDELGHMLGRAHRKVWVDQSTRDSGKGREAFGALLHQTRPFLTQDRHRELAKKIDRGERLTVDEDLLPEFARRMVGRFLINRGPNCFHAALAFHDLKMASGPLFNVKKEAGYHRWMVNYDELWRVLQSQAFYEIDPKETPLSYGDVIIYMDVVKGQPAEYRWIKHAAAYLFGNYVFSKGSKSPSTPYAVRSLDDEWETWSRLSKNLGLKVFRRGVKGGRNVPPETLLNWLY